MKIPYNRLPLIVCWFCCQLILTNCQETPPAAEKQPPNFALLTDSLAAMVERDQAIQFAHIEGESQKVRDSLYRAQDSIFRHQSDIVKEMFERYGFLDTTMVGETGSYNFWLLVQHADHDPDFQRQVLKAMAPKVEAGIADASNFALPDGSGCEKTVAKRSCTEPRSSTPTTSGLYPSPWKTASGSMSGAWPWVWSPLRPTSTP
jgi:hypothetical protein